MKSIQEIELSEDQRKAIEELRRRLGARPDVDEVLLYGSFPRGEADEESDVDLLVLTNHPLPRNTTEASRL